MYGFERTAVSLPQPLGALVVVSSKSGQSRTLTDDGVHKHEFQASPSTDNLSDKSVHSPAWEEKPDLHVCCRVPTVSVTSSPPVTGVVTLGSSSTDLKHLNYGTRTQGGGALEDEKKREREHKKRSKNWTRPETLKLIKARTELNARFVKSGRKAELWDEIANALQRDSFCRDGQQCKDKWEKLTAGYKEVRDGLRDKEDNPYFDELHHLLSGRLRGGREREEEETITKEKTENGEEGKEVGREEMLRPSEEYVPNFKMNTGNAMEKQDDRKEENAFSKKRRRNARYISVTDLSAVQELLESVVSRQQRFCSDLLDEMDRKEQTREQMRQEREEKWRAEERAQRCIFNNAMIVLTQRLLGERLGAGAIAPMPTPISPVAAEGQHLGPKKRSKNWKRTEVLQLIKLRGEMDNRFAKSTRRAALWEEIAEKLVAQEIKRDGKQCREKWDKLMAEYKDVTDGKRDQVESPYFAELTAFVGRPVETGTLNTAPNA